MFKQLTITCLFSLLSILSVSAIEHTYMEHSVLQSGHWVKIRVSETGVYQLTYEQLKSAGLQPEQVRIYGYGGSMLSQDFSVRKIDDLPVVPFWMEKGQDGQFGKGDYILFYAQANIHWTYNGASYTHTRNPYSDYGYYFLTDDAGEPSYLNESAAPISGSDEIAITCFDNYQLHELDAINLLDVSNGCDGGGREFYGEILQASKPSISFTLPFESVDISQPMRCVVDVAARSATSGLFTTTIGASSFTMSTVAIPVTDYYTMATTATLKKNVTPTSDADQVVTISFNNNGQANAQGYINFIELTATSPLRMASNTLLCRSAQQYGNTTLLHWYLANADSSTQVWNVTDLDSIYRMPTTCINDTVQWLSSNHNKIQQFIAVQVHQSGGWLTPDILGEITPQDLHQYRNIDLVIITPIEFEAQAKRIAAIHEQEDQMIALVVTDEQVYNEFSSGTPDATAYRWLMKMLYDRGVSGIHKPRHLLLFGDGTFDNRQLLTSALNPISAGGKNWLLTYQTKNSTKETDAFAMDDYFAFMDNHEGEAESSGTMEFGVGRIPVASTEEAQEMADKVIAYVKNENYGKWRSQLLFIADDGDNGLHTQTAEAGAEKVRVKNPDFIVNKVYLDAYPQETGASGESYPLAKNRIDNLINNGVLYLNYSGHGGYNGITNEGIMNIASIESMTNTNQGLWMLATCSFAHYDSGKRCAAEKAVLNPHGAAIGVFSACRTVYANQNTIINRNFCDTLFGHKDVYHYDMTIGQSARLAKNKTGNDANKLAYTLLGDPAIRLHYPTAFQVRTTYSPDTVHAVSTHELRGEIIDSTGTTMDWFNGKIQVWVYDKMQQITTRDNDETSSARQKFLTYNDYPNLIYSGEVGVVDGVFSIRFMAPLDIRYNYGHGRVVYYAYDDLNAAEAVGHYEDLIIGGSSSVSIIDTVGPSMRLYLNNAQFADGGDTHEYPHFYAQLEDVNGINTVGSGIGHDLLLTVDDDVLQNFVLNDYFQSNNGDFGSGLVSYKMGKQSEGAHQLRFRAWDLLNNSTTQYLNYMVVSGRDTEVYQVTSYPNPAKANEQITIQVDYDRPDELVETHVYFYDMSGRMVHYITQDDAKSIQCSLSQLGLTPGIYTYRVMMKTQTTSIVTKSSKLIITY